MLRVLADFNALTADETKVQLGTTLTRDLNYLKQGDRVLLYQDEDIEVEATIEIVEKADEEKIWYGVVDWKTRRDPSSSMI